MRNWFTIGKYTTMITVALLLGGCASTRQYIPIGNINDITPTTANIVITRKNQVSGWANPIMIRANGQDVGHIGPGGELSWISDAVSMSIVASGRIGNIHVGDHYQKLVGGRQYNYSVHFPFFKENTLILRSSEQIVEARDEQAPAERPTTAVMPRVAADTFAQHPHKDKAAAVLVLDARGGLSSEEAALLSDRFSVELGKMGVYKLISQSKMQEVLTLQNFTAACSSVDCAVEAGQLLGVEYIIYGSIGRIGNLYTVNVYLTSVESGSILGSATVDIKGSIEDLLTSGMGSAVDKLLLATVK